ncbi:MAG: DUF3943 domain-containing protein [Thermodesulfobacteriota bacterium]
MRGKLNGTRLAFVLIMAVILLTPAARAQDSEAGGIPAGKEVKSRQFIKDGAIYYGSIWAFRFFYVRNKNERILNTSPSAWWGHITKQPEVDDGDAFFTNYVVHPFAGYVSYLYYRRMGYGFWGSALGSALQSTLFEYTVEGLVETPSLPDLLSTPGLGVVFGAAAEYASDRLIELDNPVATFLAHAVNPMRNFVNNGRVAIMNPLQGRFEYTQSFDISHVPWKELSVEAGNPHSFRSALPRGYAGAGLEVAGLKNKKGQLIFYNVGAEVPSSDYRKSLYVAFNQVGLNNLYRGGSRCDRTGGSPPDCNPADGYELSNFIMGGKFVLAKTPSYWVSVGFESHLPTIYKDNVKRLKAITSLYKRDLPVYLRNCYSLTPFAGAGAAAGPLSFETKAAFLLVKKAGRFEGDESEKIFEYGAGATLALPVSLRTQLSAELKGNRFLSLRDGRKNNLYFTSALRFGKFISPSVAVQIPVSGGDSEAVSKSVITQLQVRF